MTGWQESTKWNFFMLGRYDWISLFVKNRPSFGNSLLFNFNVLEDICSFVNHKYVMYVTYYQNNLKLRSFGFLLASDHTTIQWKYLLKFLRLLYFEQTSLMETYGMFLKLFKAILLKLKETNRRKKYLFKREHSSSALLVIVFSLSLSLCFKSNYAYCTYKASIDKLPKVHESCQNLNTQDW